MRRRVGLRQVGFWYALAVVLLKPLAILTARRDWRGTEHVPTTGAQLLHAHRARLTFGGFRLGRFLRRPRRRALDFAYAAWRRKQRNDGPEHNRAGQNHA